jgi:hypothetical protein|tara:strand:- start:316 stop:990 length:675 start_codon:yes stop_codon:yes gene_type:complete
MKVKIKKEGKTETYNIIDSWSDVTLESWLQLVKSKDLGKAEDAKTSILALSDIPEMLINKLSLKDVAILMEKMGKLQSEQETLLKKLIYIDGQEYGFHPNLDDITIGEYADIETLIKDSLENNLPELMAVLFRPVIDRKGEAYKIEAYNGDITIRAEVMKKMSSEQVQSALVFFWNFVQELSSSLQSYLMIPLIKEMEEAAKVSAKSGDGLESSTASAIKTSVS